jgi:hypothetical protein
MGAGEGWKQFFFEKKPKNFCTFKYRLRNRFA